MDEDFLSPTALNCVTAAPLHSKPLDFVGLEAKHLLLLFSVCLIIQAGKLDKTGQVLIDNENFFYQKVREKPFLCAHQIK